MEEKASPVLTLAPEPEQSQDQVDSFSQGVSETEQTEPTEKQSENVVQEAIEDPEQSSKDNIEVKKTWGFRRSTVAQREMPVEPAGDSPDNPCPVRRSGRQSKRTDKLEEFLSTAKRTFRKSAPPSLESGDPPSQTPTDAETTSEASFDGSADTKSESPERKTRSSTRKPAQIKTQVGRQTRSRSGGASKEDGSSENEDSKEGEPKNTEAETKDEGTKEGKNIPDNTNAGDKPQTEQSSEKKEDNNGGNKSDKATDDTEDDNEAPEKPAVLVKRGPIRTYINKKRAANKNTTPVKSPAPVSKVTPVKEIKARVAKTRKPQTQDDMEDENESSTSSSSSSSSSSDESDEGSYDPNALYCICRQKHNKRFMICCDRCEEWFHGDCVGITEARGRLMERNGEDYICPNCTAKKNQVVRPATSALSANTDKPKAENAAVASSEKTKETDVAVLHLSTQAEERATDDLGIKGRIEKASNPTGKKKIKIFQPQVAQQAAESKAEQPAASTAEQKAPSDTVHKVALNVEVDTTAVAVEQAEQKAEEKAEESALPKCIGPGCENNAQPDSVYCGPDCILKHAAATMKSITDPSQKDKAKPQKSKTKSATDGKKRQKKGHKQADSDEDYSPDPEEEDEEAHAEEQPPHPSTASWSSDHNYIAVTPEKTTPISSTVLNKKSPPKEEKQAEKEQKVKEPAPTPEKPLSTAAAKPKKKSSPPAKVTKVSPKGKKPSRESASSKTSKKPATTPTKPPVKSKKQLPAQIPSPYPAGPIHVTGALRVTKSNFTIPKKQPQQRDTPAQSQSLPSSSSSKVSSSSSSSSHSSRPLHSSTPASAASPMPPPPNNQMRQNIRRSLTDILYKRVSDSDDLKMTESEVGRLAFGIEKEMFNLCLSTDSKYKNKYRSLMFNLKDPKNKGLFYRVIGGEVTPFRLVRLSPEELLSKEISEWRKSEAPEAQSPRALSKHSRHDSRSMDIEDAPPSSDADDQDEPSSTPSGSSQPSSSEGSSMPDIFSNMLKDTTSEHRTHLFDLNCKICTGQKTEDEPSAKKAKLAKKPESKPPRSEQNSRSGEVSPAHQAQIPTAYQHQEAYTYQPTPIASYHPSTEPAVPESQPQLYQEDPNLVAPPTPTSAPVAPAVSSVTITRRDPRMARHGSGVTVSYTTPEKNANNSAEPLAAPVTLPVDVGLKGPLPMPPAPPPAAPLSKTVKTSSSEPPLEGETAIFLHSQEKIWKGFINMQNVAKFVTKAYLVSGSFEHLKEDLPDTIHIGGRISPNTVWDYVGKLKTSLSKELCLIRFHPATEEEEVAYVSLFSYFSSRRRFGVVANNNRRIKDLYLIPLSSKDPLPPKLLPFDGPGLEPARPNLLLGLLICQKDRKRAGAPVETEEKRSKIQTKDTDDTGLPKPSPSKVEKSTRQSLDVPFSTTPPGSPPPLSSLETQSSIVTPASVLSLLSSVKASASTGKESPSSSTSALSSATPLQTILNTLFGKKKNDSEASNSPPDQSGEISVPSVTILDPIVKQFALSKEKPVEEDEDDRPYDPEEEYDPSRGYNVPKHPAKVEGTSKVTTQPDSVVTEGDDVAYDPEDESIFDNVKAIVPQQAPPERECKSEAQKILESLKQAGQQVQKQEPQTETLLAQQTKSLLASTQLLQLGKKVEELVKSSSVAPLINQKRDPRQSRDPRQVATSQQTDDDAEGKEEADVPVPAPAPAAAPETVPAPVPTEPEAPEPAPSNAPEAPDSSQEPDTSPPQDAVKSETLPFMQSVEEEVLIPLLGEEVETDMETSYMDENQVKTEEPEPTKSEIETDKFSVWPNAASILKSTVDSAYEETSQDGDGYYNEPKNSSIITSAIPVLTQSATMDTKSHHMPHHMPLSAFDNEYRHPPDIPPPSNFPPMQGQNVMMRPPPMPMPPPMQGPPLMSGPVPMQGPPMHIPPPGHGPPPMQAPTGQTFGPPHSTYPPYQNQWPATQPHPPQQLPPGPPQNMMPSRGLPPPFPPMAQRGPPPQMFDHSVRPQHVLPGPPPGLPPPPQNNLPPPRFSGPPPSFNVPANRGPLPPFTGPPPGHFDNRLPPPSHFPVPRGPPPSQFGGHGGPQPPMAGGPAELYNKDNSFQVEQHHPPNPLNMYKDNQGPPPGTTYRGPPPNQYEDRRGPPSSSGDLSGPHFNPHNQYESSRHHSPPHRGSFEEHRGPPSQENRPPSSQPFAGSERYRFDRHSDEPRPVRHSGPLLPTPSEGPIAPSGRMGAHSPELHREDHWRHHSPEIRRRSSSNREDSEPRSFGRFDGSHRDPSPGPPQLPEERPREMSEDRRRERERDVPHPGRPPWGRGQSRRWSREQEWERERGRDREKERSRERDRSRERERSRGRESERYREQEVERHRELEVERHREQDGERHREQEGERHREQEGERHREQEGERHREQEGERHREKDGERHREKDGERHREKDGERHREKEVERHREQEVERHREQEVEKRRERDRDRDKDKDKDRDREREHDRGRDRESNRRDHDRDRGRNRDRDRERDRERDRRRDRSRSRERDRDRGKERPRDRDRERDRDRDRERRDKSRSREKRDDKKDYKHDSSRDSEKTAVNDKK